jgi:hypothetical protein
MGDIIYEERITEGQRKCWDGEPDLSKEGWEEYREWERFDYTEERYWRRPLTGQALTDELARRDRANKRQRAKDAERAVIQAAEAWHHYWMTGGPMDETEEGRLSDALIDTVAALHKARE